MAINLPSSRSRGFALLIAIIFMSVMLSFGLSLGSLAYKQQVLASSAIGSQYAFYAADAALECALYADQQQNLFAYTSNMSAPAPAVTCDAAAPVSATVVSHTPNRWVISNRFSLDAGARCADVTIYKPSVTSDSTFLFSQGYDASCATVANPAGARFSSRGMQVHYGAVSAPGMCGSANGATVPTAPSTNLCIPESGASFVAGNGPWTWSCAGTSRGPTAYCSANLATTYDGQCALSHYNCSLGSSINNVSSQNNWTWTCTGTGGGAAVGCSEVKVLAGVCSPNHYSCDVGSSASHQSNSDFWTWTCRGQNGGLDTSCSESRAVNGVCDATHYNCTAGSSTNNSSNQSNWTWSCAGQNGGTTAACSETKVIGSSWTARTGAASNSWNSVTYGNGIFAAVASSGSGNRVMTSPDGTTWTSRSSAANNRWNSVTYGNGTFVAVSEDDSGAGNRVMTSPDGTTWTARTGAANNSWTSVAYGNGTFVAVSSDGSNRVMTSPDGTTWTSRSSAANNSWTSVAYGLSLFVAVADSGNGNRVMTSPDGTTWTSQSSAADNRWNSVTYGNGTFVAVSEDDSGVGNRVMTSL